MNQRETVDRLIRRAISQLRRHVKYLKYESDSFSDSHKSILYTHKGTSFSRISLLCSFNLLLVPVTLGQQFKLHTRFLKSFWSLLSICHCRLKMSTNNEDSVSVLQGI